MHTPLGGRLKTCSWTDGKTVPGRRSGGGVRFFFFGSFLLGRLLFISFSFFPFICFPPHCTDGIFRGALLDERGVQMERQAVICLVQSSRGSSALGGGISMDRHTMVPV